MRLLPWAPPASLAILVAAASCNQLVGNRDGHAYADASPDVLADDAGDDASETSDGSAPSPCAAAPCVVASGRDCPSDLRVYAGRVYWSDQGSAQQSAKDGVVASAPVDGCPQGSTTCPTVIVSPVYAPAAIDVTSAGVFWTTFDGGVMQLAFGGDAGPQQMAQSMNGPRWLAHDATHLFWTDQADFQTPDGDVRVEYQQGGTPNGVAIAQGQTSPLAVVFFDGRVYFTADGDTDSTGYVGSVDSQGGNVARIGNQQSHPRGLFVDSTYVYWTNLGDGTIHRALHDGSQSKTLLQGLAAPSDVAVDSTALYWVEAGHDTSFFTDGTVMTAALDGSNPRAIATNRVDPRRLVLDGDSVYWIDRGTQNPLPCSQHDGKVMRASKK